MDKLASTTDLKDLQARLQADRDPALPTIVIPAGTCGQASGANDLIRVTKRELLARGLADAVRLRITGCHGFCEAEPSVLVEPRGTFYPKVNLEGMVRIVAAVAAGSFQYPAKTFGPRISSSPASWGPQALPSSRMVFISIWKFG